MALDKAFAAVTSSAVTLAFFINLCAALFACGCRSWWAGAAAHCNIHNAQSRHCPWCAYGMPGSLLALGLILAPQLAVSLWPSDWSWRKRLALALALFPGAGAPVGLVYGWLSGYWA
jgi:hypothetical protein